MLAGTLCIADRQLLGIVAIPVRHELGLSNTQVGLATGFAFALFYTGLGVPIAWLADRYNRVWILVVSLVAWSAMTALSGRAHSFSQLFLARAGVGVGEAGYSPASLALVSDLTAPAKRASRLAMLTSTACRWGPWSGWPLAAGSPRSGAGAGRSICSARPACSWRSPPPQP